MWCYRRHGHNEGDDPSYTQPQMYRRIENRRSVRKLYTETLVNRGDITLEEAEKALESFSARLQTGLDETRQSAPPKGTIAKQPAPSIGVLPHVETGVPRETLDRVAAVLHEAPANFTVHPKLAKQLETRKKLYAEGQVDWALAEALAFGTILLAGTDIRLSGQDTRRGTFSQRHSVLVCYDTGTDHTPLNHLSADQGRFRVYDSLLSEYAALGFEYGYSVVAKDALVAWEAQFGDFVNGAQIVIDQFLVAAEDKWQQTSGLVLLLPHGYEGQGPEHSSARVERFLTMCAEDNVQVVNCTTAAQYFHVLRRQVARSVRKPLIIFTPKSLLRSARRARRSRRSRAARSRRCSTIPPSPTVAVMPRGRSGWCWRAARWPTTPSPSATTPSSRLRSCGSSSSTRGPRRGSPRCWRATNGRRRWSGCRRSPRTWAPGRSCTGACTACCATTSPCAMSAARVGEPGHRELHRPPAGAGAARGAGAQRLTSGERSGKPTTDSSSAMAASGSTTLIVVIPMARGLEVAADVVEEDGLAWLDRELLARQLVEAGVGLAHPDLARLDDDVEEIGEQAPVGRGAAVVGRDPVVRQARGLEPLVAPAHGLDHGGAHVAREQRHHLAGVDLAARRPRLALVEAAERVERHVAALELRPCVVVGAGRVEPPEEAVGQVALTFVAGERLERAREDHPAEIEERGPDHGEKLAANTRSIMAALITETRERGTIRERRVPTVDSADTRLR